MQSSLIRAGRALPRPSLATRRHFAVQADGQNPANKVRFVPSSGQYPTGFRVGSSHVGVKASNTKLDDVAVIVSDSPCSAAAVFTTNKFQAAPVVVSRDTVRSRAGAGIRGVVINSGCANAVTGAGGLEDARRMAGTLDRCLGAGDEKPASLVMSTGVIGQRLPIQKIVDGIPAAFAGVGASHNHWMRAARAICTTDTFPKLVSRSFTLPSCPGSTFRLAGMTKGAGMIHPNMATLLGVMCTDAAVSPSALQSILTSAVGKSFNSISIDGDTSTNDTVAILANGAGNSDGTAPAVVVSSRDESPADYAALEAAVTDVAADLAKLVVRDGEGATKFVTVSVTGARSDADADRIASSIGTSALVKTALYGKDANWGRIVCAVGYTAGLESATESVVPARTSVSFVPADGSAELKLLVEGEPEVVDEARAAEILAMEDLAIVVKLDAGDEARPGKATFWTCDLSHEYVTINGDYRT